MRSDMLTPPAVPMTGFSSHVEESVRIPLNGIDVAADLVVPSGARGLVVFVLACGCIRETPRASLIAREIEASGIATLTLPLLTPAESEKDRDVGCWSFDLELLSHRFLRVTSWAMQEPLTRDLGIGYMASSTFAAAALIAAAQLGQLVRAVVARSGRPDFARAFLRRVLAPTLLIVGDADPHLAALNERALSRLICPKQISRVAGGTNCFEEPGALEQVAALAAGWFGTHLSEARTNISAIAPDRAASVRPPQPQGVT